MPIDRTQQAYAPYNFVPFPEKIIERYESFDDLPAHNGENFHGKKLLSGEIKFNIIARTSILVADGTDRSDKQAPHRFVKNAQGEYEIPGSTLRGLIRQTLSVLSLSNWTNRMDNRTFYYRAVAGNKHVRKAYSEILGLKQESVKGKQVCIAKNVKAGYIVKTKDNEYVIYQAKTDGGRHGKSYYKCHQRDFQFLKKNIAEGFEICEATFSINEHGKVTQLNREKGRFKGKLVFSGPMKGKKTAYLVNEIDTDESKIIAIRDADLKAYQADYDFRCTKFGDSEKGKKQKNYFQLPEEVGIQYAKPCFYIYLDGRLYFGFTAYLRLTYVHSTKDLLPKHLQTEYSGIDYVSALFGFTNLGEEGENYASRLSFLNAQIDGLKEPMEVNLILGQPQASALGMYLEQPQKKFVTKTYNDKTAKLCGLKQYWVNMHSENHSKYSNGKESVSSRLHLLPKESKFKAVIRFDQIHEDELGLLLWSIQAPVYHQIGMGKPYGYGVVQFDDIKACVYDNENMYNLLEFYDMGIDEVSSDEYIDKYKKYVSDYFDVNIEEQESVRIFLKMKDQSPLPPDQMKYMDLKQYQKMPVLPTAQSLLGMQIELAQVKSDKRVSKLLDKQVRKKADSSYQRDKKEKRTNFSSNKKLSDRDEKLRNNPFGKLKDLFKE